MGGWKKTLQSHALHPQQQFRNTSGKNATDSALIIDAMDLLHSGTIGGFCIVSSDADFTRLATRIREQGLFVMGIGKPEDANAVRQCLRPVRLHHQPRPQDQDEGQAQEEDE